MKKTLPSLTLLILLAILAASCSGTPKAQEPTPTRLVLETATQVPEPTETRLRPSPTVQRATQTAPPASSKTAPPETPSMPFITEDHQGFPYGPGQRVIVIVEGFEPHSAITVSLHHEEQGLLDTYTIDPIDNRGKVPLYHTVDGSYPNGKFIYHVKGSEGTEKTYTFFLDHSSVVDSVPYNGCGVYPEPELGSTVIAWCTGYPPTDKPVEVRGVVEGEELFTDDDTMLWSDGVITYLLDIFEDDPAGEWTLEMGEKETFTFDIGATHD